MTRENCCIYNLNSKFNLRQKIYNIKYTSDVVKILQNLNKNSTDDLLDILYIEFTNSPPTQDELYNWNKLTSNTPFNSAEDYALTTLKASAYIIYE